MGLCNGCQCNKDLLEESLFESIESERSQNNCLNKFQYNSQSNQRMKSEIFSNDDERFVTTKGAIVKTLAGSSKKNESRNKIASNISSIGRVSTSDDFNRIVPEKYIKYSIENPIEENIGDTDNFIPLKPIRLHNGNYYWGNWNEDIEMSGPGKMYLVKEMVYVEGVWKNGSIYKGRIQMPNGSIYEGELNDCQLHGKGTLLHADGKKYKGCFANGNREGKGTLIYPDGSMYDGLFLNDMFDGEGAFKWSDGHEYKGDFQADCLNGKGVLSNKKGSNYDGEFKNNLFHGQGVYKWSTGEKYNGRYKYGMKEGKGEYSSDDNVYYNGEWLDGIFHGPMTIQTKNGEYVSFWRNGNMVEISSLNHNTESNAFDLDCSLLKEDIDPNKLQYIYVNNNQVIPTERSFEPNEVVLVEGIL